MADLGVKERIEVALDFKEQLTYDPTKDLVVKLDNKKEIIMTQQMIVSSTHIVLFSLS